MSPIDRELERTLAQRAGQLEPPADLYAAVTKEAGAMRRRRQGAVAGAALTVLAIAIAVPLALRDGSPRNNNDFAGPGTPTPTSSSEPTTEPSGVESPTTAPSAAPPAVSGAVPVYYVGRPNNDRPVLYREFHRTDIAPGKALVAARHAVAVPADDPDYNNGFPSGSTVNAVTVSGTEATVDLNKRATEGFAGADGEGSVIDALVWTVTAADTSVKTVKFTVDGEVQEDFWGHFDLSDTFRRSAQENVLAPVWLLQPEPGSKVARTFTIGGQATVFEANVSWEVHVGGTRVANGFATASAGAPARGNWTATVTLPASVPSGAQVEIQAFEHSAEDGSMQWVDSKTVTLA